MPLTRVPSIPHLAPPYGLLAAAYDDVIGRDFFERIRRVFEHLVARHRIAFSSAADLGCGTGLFARYLNALWRVPVFGVDLSPAMLRIAASNCSDTNVTLLHQDIRRLRLPRRVDLVTANFDTLNHLVNDGELRAVFRRVYDHLHPGGHFIFDFITPCDPLGTATVVQHRQSRDRRRHITQRITWAPARRTLLFQILFREPAPAAPRLELHCERTYWPQDIATWLMEAGLVLRDVLDAATLRRATACHRRIIVVAQKPASRLPPSPHQPLSHRSASASAPARSDFGSTTKLQRNKAGLAVAKPDTMKAAGRSFSVVRLWPISCVPDWSPPCSPPSRLSRRFANTSFGRYRRSL